MKHKFYMTAELKSVKETKELQQAVASVIDLPHELERQPDLAYFVSRFVSTGTNLNNAHFLASELVKAGDTIPGKAVDIEHIEDKIIGHIYRYEFTDKDGNFISKKELSNKEVATLDTQDMHIEIASVVYKDRFPEVAKEIYDGHWKVSMEAYFSDWDIKIGDTIIPKDEALLMGIEVANEEIYGNKVKLTKSGKVVDEGKVVRVLRDICFSGVGIVKNPANPPSVVLDATASTDDSHDEVIPEYDLDIIEKNNKVTSSIIEKEEVKAELQYDDTVGICVSYHKELLNSINKDQDSEVIHENWCVTYDKECPVYGEALDPKCLRFTEGDMIYTTSGSVIERKKLMEIVNSKLEELNKDVKIQQLVEKIECYL